MPRIVRLNVFTAVAPTPNNLQQKGPLISQGATTITTGSFSLLTQDSDLTPLLAAALSLSSLTWSAGTATATAAANIPGLASGDTFITTIAGATPAGYNGTYLATVTGDTTFTFALASDPGSESTPGTYTPPSQQELIAMVDEFYTQGQSQAVYVLELGAGDGTSGPPALSTWIEDNPGVFYSYLLPRLWDAASSDSPTLTLMKAYSSDTSMTYFFIPTTTANYPNYKGIKSAVPLVEAPNSNSSLASFDCASPFQEWLSNNPSAATPMRTMQYRYCNGTTAWPDEGYAATIAAMDTAYGTDAGVNYIMTGSQGGQSNENILAWGYTADGTPLQWWYAVDNLQINLPLALAAAIIDASNDDAPLDYDQDGIDNLQDVGLDEFNSAAAANLLNGTVSGTDLTGTQFTQNFNDGDYNGLNVLNAIPFATWVAANPSAYFAQQYGGFSAVVTPMLGFGSIILDLIATQFA